MIGKASSLVNGKLDICIFKKYEIKLFIIILRMICTLWLHVKKCTNTGVTIENFVTRY